MATKAAKRAALYHRESMVDQNPAAARKELRVEWYTWAEISPELGCTMRVAR